MRSISAIKMGGGGA